MVKLGPNRYGKAEVRVVHVGRAEGERDRIRDWNVSTSLAGDLDATHLSGDNSGVLTTDAQKNTVYAMFQELGDLEPEAFALHLARHFVSTQKQIHRARVAIESYGWRPIGGDHSFQRTGEAVRRTVVILDETAGASVVSGVGEMIVMNTTNSEFWGYPKDRYTTLPETKDRILATQVEAWWRWRDTEQSWGAANDAAIETLTATFAETYSYSLQQMLFTMGSRILDTLPGTCEVRLSLPNKHHFLVDLEPFGQSNDNEVYFAADRPYGLIEGHVLADDAPDSGIAWT